MDRAAHLQPGVESRRRRDRSPEPRVASRRRLDRSPEPRVERRRRRDRSPEPRVEWRRRRDRSPRKRWDRRGYVRGDKTGTTDNMEATIERIKKLLFRIAAKRMRVLDILQNMPVLFERDIDQLLKTCRRRRLYDCLILAAVWYGRTEHLLRWRNNGALSLESRHLLQGNLLADLLAGLTHKHRLWPSWDQLLSGCSHNDVLGLLKFLSCNSVNSEALSLFEMLLGRFAADRNIFLDITESVLTNGLKLQFEIIMCCANNHVQELPACERGGEEHREGGTRSWMREVIDELLSSTYVGRCYTRATAASTNSLNDSLVMAAQAGLFSALVDGPQNCLAENTSAAFSFAAGHNQPDVVKFLYSTGTVSNGEVFELSRNPELAEKCSRNVTMKDPGPADREDFPAINDVLAAREIRNFVVAKASEPRSLKSMCLAQVSKGLGWGNARKVAVQEMDIPQTLKDDLMTNCNKTLLRYRKEEKQ